MILLRRPVQHRPEGRFRPDRLRLRQACDARHHRRHGHRGAGEEAETLHPGRRVLSAEIKAWVDKYGEKSSSPFASEDVIGVYSYTKANGSGSGAGGSVTWQDVYANELNRWRKVSF